MRWCFGLALALLAGSVSADVLRFSSRTVLKVADPAFGGLSAIEMRTGGLSAIVLSDRGSGFRLTFDRKNGVPHLSRVEPHRNPAPDRDSEGLAATETDLFFSYEGPAAIRAQDGTVLNNHADFAGFHINGGLEALAADGDGTLYALAERPAGQSEPFAVYRFRAGRWDIARRLQRDGPFQPTAADVGPDGQLFVLERSFSLLGFRSRIRKIDPNDPDQPAQTLLETRLGAFDNLEGLSVWQTATGTTCLTMVSDNNFLPIQTSELVEYVMSNNLATQESCE